MLSLHLGRVGTRPALSVRFNFPHHSTRKRCAPCPTYALAQGSRFFATSPVTRAPTSSTPTPTRRSILSRFLPSSFSSSTDGSIPTSTSFRKIIALARPERRPLLTAIGLLLVSSSVSLSIPFTVGQLIDYFTSSNPVGLSIFASISNHGTELGFIVFPIPQTIPYGVSLTQATAGLFLVFTIGGACNAGRAFLMRMSGAS
jgi:putative ABC transport system ATP-binding protein